MEASKKLGKNLKKLRLKRKLSQGELSKSLNVDRTYISNIENGKMNEG
jgi:transcriptional regulator with XRE-family HTH domain